MKLRLKPLLTGAKVKSLAVQVVPLEFPLYNPSNVNRSEPMSQVVTMRAERLPLAQVGVALATGAQAVASSKQPAKTARERNANRFNVEGFIRLPTRG
jgi:hypothetical protein